MFIIPEKLPKYKPAWNIEFYRVLDKAQLELEETQASREVIDLYSEISDFAGVVIILDNLNKKIWVWCSIYTKSTGWAKKIIAETNPKKISELVLKILSDEMKVDFSDYKVEKVTEGNHPDDFEKLFLYDVVDVNLYQQHYYKPEYEHLYTYEQQEKAESATKKCKNCNWIMSSDKKVCPRCRKDPDVADTK